MSAATSPTRSDATPPIDRSRTTIVLGPYRGAVASPGFPHSPLRRLLVARLYDSNPDGPAPLGFEYVPTIGAAPDVHCDRTVSFLPALAGLKAQSKSQVESVGGTEVSVLVFLDWPTDSINTTPVRGELEIAAQHTVRIFDPAVAEPWMVS